MEDFTYEDSEMAQIIFEELKKLDFYGASVSFCNAFVRALIYDDAKMLPWILLIRPLSGAFCRTCKKYHQQMGVFALHERAELYICRVR